MKIKIPQIVPSQTCLNCQGCCRFYEEKSLWRPRLNKEEAPNFDKNVFDQEFFVKTTKVKDLYFCQFINQEDNSCKIYSRRPFECALYPAMIVKENNKLLVVAHLNCPFVAENKNKDFYTSYIEDLRRYFSSKEAQKITKINTDKFPSFKSIEKEIEVLFPIFEISK